MELFLRGVQQVGILPLPGLRKFAQRIDLAEGHQIGAARSDTGHVDFQALRQIARDAQHCLVGLTGFQMDQLDGIAHNLSPCAASSDGMALTPTASAEPADCMPVNRAEAIPQNGLASVCALFEHLYCGQNLSFEELKKGATASRDITDVLCDAKLGYGRQGVTASCNGVRLGRSNGTR